MQFISLLNFSKTQVLWSLIPNPKSTQLFVRSSAKIGLDVKVHVLPSSPLPRLLTQWYQRGFKVIVTLRGGSKLLNSTIMAHDFAVTLQTLLSCVTIQTVALVKLQGKDLILKRSAGVHFKGLVRASTLLLIPPRLMTMLLAKDLVQLSEFRGILVTAQFFYVTLLLEANTPFNIVAYLNPHLDTIHSMGKAGANWTMMNLSSLITKPSTHIT